VALNVPALQGVAALAAVPHHLPTSHASHAVALDDDWNSPTLQSWHVLAPPAAPNRPGAQAIGTLERSTQ
jgi:hypothetical protein